MIFERYLRNKNKEQGQPMKPSLVILEIAEAFSNAPITRSNLDRHGICELEVKYLDEVVRISWFSNGNMHNLSIGGKRTLGTSSEAKFILAAAIARAERMFEEDLAKLEEKRRRLKGVSSDDPVG